MAVGATPTCRASIQTVPGAGAVWSPPTGARAFKPPLIEAESARREPITLIPPSAEINPLADIAPLETMMPPVTVPVDVRPPLAEIRLVALIVPLETMVAPVTVPVDVRPLLAEISPDADSVPVDTTPAVILIVFCVSWSKPPMLVPLELRHTR